MQDEIPRLALFPLGLVLLPGEQLPMHIFEPRYQRLIREAIEDDAPFALVLGRDQAVARVATRARIAQVLQRYPDGKCDLIVEGTGRCTFAEANQEEDGLIVARGEEVEDVSTQDDSGATQAMQQAWKRWCGVDLVDLEEDHGPLSWFVAKSFGRELGLESRQRLLEMRSEPKRLRRLAKLVAVATVRRQEREAGQAHARTNGVASHRPSSPEN